MPETILVTGATGFIARHIVAGLLNRGYAVTGSARDTARDGEIRTAIAPALDDPAALERYRTVTLDLTSDDGWDAAMDGAGAVMHTASPFPLVQPKDENDLIEPAVAGAKRALEAATKAGTHRVILTSSMAAISARDAPGNGTAYTEDDWSDLSHAIASPYFKSKTLAERAAWDFAGTHPDMNLTTINPGFVLGPPLGASDGTSSRVVERVLSGKDPMLPRLGFTVVDVRDVAEAHIRALERPETAGQRILVADRFLWFADLAGAIARALPHRRIATRQAPNVVMRMLGLFDSEIRSILPALGREEPVSNAKARQLLGLEFRDGAAAAADMALWLEANAAG